jgi:hypothetical protein
LEKGSLNRKGMVWHRGANGSRRRQYPNATANDPEPAAAKNPSSPALRRATGIQWEEERSGAEGAEEQAGGGERAEEQATEVGMAPITNEHLK